MPIRVKRSAVIFCPFSDEMKYSAEMSYNQDPTNQMDRDRLERKRERNRVAANKCR